MIGMNLVRRIDRVRKQALNLGFEFHDARHSFGGLDGSIGWISLRPATHEPFTVEPLPIYNRDAEIFTGDLDAVEHFLSGLVWARQYDEMLKLSSDKTRKSAEQRYHVMMLERQEKAEQKRILEILKTPEAVLNTA
jgi:hypothetical protein